MKLFRIILLALVIFAGCHKKDKHPDEATSPAPQLTPDVSYPCQDLPPTPIPFGWYDSLPDKNKSINAFLVDPVDPDQIIYVVNGDAYGYNKLFFYNVPSGQARYICNLGNYLPQVNAKGWITYSDLNNNIFLVKNNGNTIVQLTTNSHNFNPKWDYSGTMIYYYSEAFGSITAQMNKVDTSGVLKNFLEASSPYLASFKTSDKLLMLELDNNSPTSQVIYTDLAHPANNKTLLSGPAYSKTGQINFDNLTVDNTDENFFWSNSNGIFRCNISSLKIDTLVKNCPNLIFRNPIVALKSNELTYSLELLTPLNSLRLLHQFKTLDMNLYNKQVSEIKIYP